MSELTKRCRRSGASSPTGTPRGIAAQSLFVGLIAMAARGIAAQSLFVGLIAMAANIRKIAAHRALVADGLGPQVAERARRRRMSITDYLPPPAG
ncbi:MAG: hypothetical protein ABSD78_02990 [Acidimicrobiales bacterium]